MELVVVEWLTPVAGPHLALVEGEAKVLLDLRSQPSQLGGTPGGLGGTEGHEVVHVAQLECAAWVEAEPTLEASKVGVLDCNSTLGNGRVFDNLAQRRGQKVLCSGA